MNTKKLILFISVLVSSSYSIAQKISVEEMEVLFMYYFGQNIEWPNSDEETEFSIHYIGDNQEFVHSMELLAKHKKIQNKTIKFTHSIFLKNIPESNIVFLANSYNYELNKVLEKIETSPTLLVTRDCKDLKSVMINMYLNEESQMNFEINRPNVIIKWLNPGPNLLLHGGTEIDIVEIYRQNKEKYESALDSLKKERAKVDLFKVQVNTLRQELNVQLAQLEEKHEEVERLNNSLKFVNDTLKKQQKELEKQKNALHELQTEIAETQATLVRSSSEAEAKENLTKQLEEEINSKLLELNQYNSRIESQQHLIKNQEKELNTSQVTIQNQRIYLAIALLIAILISFLLFLLMKANQKRKKAYGMLNKQKELLVNQTQTLNEQKNTLETTLDELKNAQSQLIQSEKMASLGQITAGIAHEINTPLGAINSSADNIKDNYAFISNNLAQLIKELDEVSFSSFQSLITTNSNEEYSTRESRQVRKLIKTKIEEWAPEYADELSRTFIDLRIYSEIEQFRELIIHPKQKDIFRTAYSIKQLLYSSKNITNAVQKASKIVFALKNYARKDFVEEKEETNLKENINSVLTIYQNNLKNVKLTTSLPSLSKKLFAYIDELGQVWTNLIYNAIQAMEYKGSLEIAYEEVNEIVIIQIKDSGPGIPLDVQEHIFTPFFTTKPRGEGTGLGLDIVKKIVEKHNGKIYFKSQLSIGTTFYIELPLEKN